MKFDLYTNYSEEIKKDDNTMEENSVRRSFRNLTLEDVKSKVNEFFDSIPENATNAYLELHKSYNEQMDAALSSI